ncbi:hypothetical protein BJX99DRAFT_220175 [Aspergillus californicus]
MHAMLVCLFRQHFFTGSYALNSALPVNHAFHSRLSKSCMIVQYLASQRLGRVGSFCWQWHCCCLDSFWPLNQACA